MNSLYSQVLASNKNRGLTKVEDLIDNSGLSSIIRNKLQSEGYAISNLSLKGVAILFCALVDILYVVKDNQFYIVTLCEDKIKELAGLSRLIPRNDEKDFQKSYQILQSNTKSVINQYLLQGKFHFIKLNMHEHVMYQFFMASIGTMNPYPSLETEDVYTLTDLSSWHNELYNALMSNCIKLHIGNTTVICSSRLSRNRSLCTSGELLTNDIDNNPVYYKLWEISSYEKYSKNTFISSLLNGVVKFDDKYITLNREVLEKYYGTSNLYTKLESLGVRQRYCLEELMSLGQKFKVTYYLKKYGLDYYECQSLFQLEQKLKSILSEKSVKFQQGYVSARVLFSYNSIETNHRSYYMKIDLSSLNAHSIEVVDDITAILPKQYKYYGISASLGYNCVVVNATSIDLALKYGATEFKRQFGEDNCFCSLYNEDLKIKGNFAYKIGIEVQRRLYQAVSWGYNKNYQGYSSIVKEIALNNGLDIKDEYIKYLYINKLAKKYRNSQDIKLGDVIKYLVELFDLIINKKADEKLKSEYEKIAIRKCIHEYNVIAQSAPKYQGYMIDDTPEGRFITTNNARYRLKKDNTLCKKVDLLHDGVFIGSKMIG